MDVLRRWVWRLFKGILFQWDAETVHQVSIRLIQLGRCFRNAPLRILSGSENPRKFSQREDLPEVLGMKFLSRVGLAAGFDKNAEILTALPALGFGFVEIGSVTPRAQPGNDRPRLFREVAKQSLFNRMGFNGLGASLIAHRVRLAKESLPSTFRVGVNLGKNKETPLEDAPRDYVKAAREFEGLADYLVINVSSPNTPGLRSLQTVEALSPILQSVNHLIAGWRHRPPLLLKLAPELNREELQELIEKLETKGVDGWVLTNTLGGKFSFKGTDRDGGWSGGILTEPSRQSLREGRSFTRKPIISVGGILSANEALLRVQGGADLIQIYTGWVYRGPSFPPEISRCLR